MSKIEYENKEEKYLVTNQSNKKKTRNYLILILSVLFVFGFVLIFSSIRKINTIANRESGMVDYKVYLKDNDFYQDKYLEKGMQYIASLIDTIDVSYDYNSSFSDTVNYEYDYDVTAKILVTDKYDNSKVLYTKEETLKENVHGSGKDKNFRVTENVDINYDKYNSYVNAFKSTYALDVDSNLVVTMSVKSKGNYNDKNISNKVSDLTISIPLTKNTIDIAMNTNKLDNNIDIAIDESVIANKFVFYTGIITVIVSLLSFIILLLSKRDNNDIYRREINKILKNYDRLIITSSQPSIDESNYKNVVVVETIEELLDVTEISNEPIIFYEVVPDEKSYFIVLKQDTLYKLTISRTMLEKLKKTDKKVEE